MILEGELESLLEPGRRALSLTRDELLLLDWVLTFPLPQAHVDLDWHMTWREFREHIWARLHALENAQAQMRAMKQTPPTEIATDISMDIVPVLLAVVPTTFRWGTGADCGYSLKLKLYRYLSGEEEWHEEPKPTDDDAGKDEAQPEGGASEGTVASTGEVLPDAD